MLEPYAENYDKYLEYAFRICGCNDLKYDMVNDMFLKLEEVLTEEPSKEISDGYIFIMMKYSYLNLVSRKKEYAADTSKFILTQEDNELLKEREMMSRMLSKLPFKDREILMKCQEKSFRELGRMYGMHHTTISKIYSESMEKLREECQKQD